MVEIDDWDPSERSVKMTSNKAEAIQISMDDLKDHN